MLQTEIRVDGLPLHLLENARDPDPALRPSSTQSCLHVTTREQFLALPRDQQHAILRYRCVLMVDIGSEPPPEFEWETLARFRDPDALCEIQGL